MPVSSMISGGLSSRFAPRGWIVTVAAACVTFSGCSPSSLVDVQSPSTIVDPSTIKTAAGAMALRLGALATMMRAATGTQEYGVIGQSALLTDEAQCGRCDFMEIDARKLIPGNESSTDIQTARVTAHIAREALLAYANNSAQAPRAWQGEMYALEGYTVLWLAELYCSGMPIATVPLSGAPIPSRGLTTQELLAKAVTLFDSAAALGADSANFFNLAHVGKGRALLDLGQFAAADSAVAAVPDDFVYRLVADSNGTTQGRNALPNLVSFGYFRVQDHEGGDGLSWSADPRAGVVEAVDGPSGFLWPSKYNVTASGQFDPKTNYDGVRLRLGDGLEARLIQAEAALARGDGAWLTILNTLRSVCVESTPCAPVPGLTATTLAPLADPGSDTARVSLVMQERAMWLYFTGHREGDLRRLAHVYHRDPTTLWPRGTYASIAFPSLGIQSNPFYNGQPYGTAVVFQPRLSNEQVYNPLYGGCYDLNP